MHLQFLYTSRILTYLQNFDIPPVLLYTSSFFYKTPVFIHLQFSIYFQFLIHLQFLLYLQFFIYVQFFIYLQFLYTSGFRHISSFVAFSFLYTSSFWYTSKFWYTSRILYTSSFFERRLLYISWIDTMQKCHYKIKGKLISFALTVKTTLVAQKSVHYFKRTAFYSD